MPVIVDKPCYLVLEDGTIFSGTSFGANLDTEGEVGKSISINFKVRITTWFQLFLKKHLKNGAKFKFEIF